MKLPDGTVLMHGRAPYDPVKAHEYYIRTRELKGRRKGASKPGYQMRRKETYSVKTGKGTVKLTGQQLAEQRAYAAQRVATIKKKLARLNAELKKRMLEAKRNQREAAKPKSAAEKADAAREAKKYRDKNQQKIANKAKSGGGDKKGSSKPNTDTVEGLKETIKSVQRSLDAAVQRQRALSAATKNG